MDKITKLPWKATMNPFEISSYVYIIQKDSYISDGKVAVVDNMTDAEYICRAVNSHEGLVEAVEIALRALEVEGISKGLNPHLNHAEHFLKQALKAAQEEK